MIPELRVDGADQLARVSRALKQADPLLSKELAAGIRQATEPLKKEAEAELAAVLPKRGGAAAAISADTKVLTQRRGRGRNPGVRLRSRSRRNVRRMERGILRHPLFGNRDHWFNTIIKPGWFSRPITEGADDLRVELSRRLRIVADKIARSAR